MSISLFIKIKIAIISWDSPVAHSTSLVSACTAKDLALEFRAERVSYSCVRSKFAASACLQWFRWQSQGKTY